MPRRQVPSRLLGVVTTVALTAVASIAGAVGASAGAPPYTLDERALAIAGPALIYVEARFEGFMRSKATGQALHESPIVVSSRCSGFVVSTEGHAVTTTHCLQPSADSLRGAASFILANSLVKEKKLAPEQRTAYIQDIGKTADFTGATRDAQPSAKIYGQPFVGTSGASIAIEAGLVEAVPPADGDLALIKLAHKGLPVVEMGADAFKPDTKLVQIGFGTSETTETATYTVRSRVTKVLSRFGTKTPAVYKMDSDLGSVSHGGMVVDMGGRVVGVITNDFGGKDKSNFLAVDATSLQSLLAAAGAANTMDPLDHTYRAALDAYFGGRYSEAIKGFDTVLAAVPAHAPAAAYRKQAADRLAIEGDPAAGTPRWIFAMIFVFAGLIFLLIGVIIVTILRGRSRAARQAQIVGPYPPSGVPVSGMPVSGTPISGVPVSGYPFPGAQYEYPEITNWTVEGSQPNQPSPSHSPWAPQPPPES